jgi:hypothetical protein
MKGGAKKKKRNLGEGIKEFSLPFLIPKIKNSCFPTLKSSLLLVEY